MYFQVKRTPIKGMFELGEVEHKWPSKVDYKLDIVKGLNQIEYIEYQNAHFPHDPQILNLINFLNFRIEKKVSFLNPHNYVNSIAWHTDGWSEFSTHILMCIYTDNENAGTLFTNRKVGIPYEAHSIDYVSKPYHIYLLPKSTLHKSPQSINEPRFMHRYFLTLSDEQIKTLNSLEDK
jgi:hypothetical protein